MQQTSSDAARRGTVIRTAMLLALLLSACGGAEDVGAPTPEVDQDDRDEVEERVEDAIDDAEDLAGDVGSSGDGGCPITDDQLEQLTGSGWTQRGPTQGEVPWLDGVPATTCAFASEETGAEGDPVLVVRTDEVEGEHVATFRDDFVSNCEGFGATVVPSERVDGALLCEEADGLVQEMLLDRGGSLVGVVIQPGFDEQDARQLTPVLEELLALLR